MFKKKFARLKFNARFNIFFSRFLFTKSQSGFIPGNSSVAQLLGCTTTINSVIITNTCNPRTLKSFYCNPSEDVRGFFQKAFEFGRSG